MQVKRYRVHPPHPSLNNNSVEEFHFSPEVLREKVARANRIVDEIEREERAERDSLAEIAERLTATGVTRLSSAEKNRPSARILRRREKEKRRVRREAGL